MQNLILDSCLSKFSIQSNTLIRTGLGWEILALISVGHSELKQGFGTAGSCSFKHVSLVSLGSYKRGYCITLNPCIDPYEVNS